MPRSTAPSRLRLLGDMVWTRRQYTPFPLFELPLELRTHIYEHLFGGHIIHVGCSFHITGTDSDEVVICKAEVSDAEFAAAPADATAPNDWAASQNLFVTRHSRCDRHPKRRIRRKDLSILLTCKQAHKEAAGIVFSANTFTFFTLQRLENFLLSLTPMQRKNMANILLYVTNNRRAWQNPLSATLVSALSGLKHLTVYIELCPADLSFDPEGKGDLRDEAARNSILTGLRPLRHLELKSVTVYAVDGISFTEYGRDEFLRSLTHGCEILKPERLKEWAAHLRFSLLPTSSGQ